MSPARAVMAGMVGFMIAIVVAVLVTSSVAVPPLYRNVGTALMALCYFVPFAIVRYWDRRKSHPPRN